MKYSFIYYYWNTIQIGNYLKSKRPIILRLPSFKHIGTVLSKIAVDVYTVLLKQYYIICVNSITPHCAFNTNKHYKSSKFNNE